MHFPEKFQWPSRFVWTAWRRHVVIAGIAFALLLIGFLLLYARYFGPVDRYAGQQEFIVNPDDSFEKVAGELKDEGFIRSTWVLRLAYARNGKSFDIREGGYELSASMDAWSIAAALARPPYLAWITFQTGLRKEQIADLLAKKLSWSDEQKEEFITVDTAPSESLSEGVYYGDTYLIPSDQTPAQVADRLRGRFQDVFAPYAEEAKKQGVAWTDVITMASLIQREAASTADMPLIAGIMWNRLDDGQPLAIDATLQYIRGVEGDWWPVPKSADKYLVSPFNTYKHKGLPPHPIANPGLAAIKAVLHPEKTRCYFYLHAPDGNIHCSVTYAGQIANVNKYLK